MHDYFTDDELWGYLQALDVSVLPYRFGTHSGWLEACHDLGTWSWPPTAASTPSSAPACSYAADGPGRRRGAVAPGLRQALVAATGTGPRGVPTPAPGGGARAIARVHEEIYADVLADVARSRCAMHVVILAASRHPLASPSPAGSSR